MPELGAGSAKRCKRLGGVRLTWKVLIGKLANCPTGRSPCHRCHRSTSTSSNSSSQATGGTPNSSSTTHPSRRRRWAASRCTAVPQQRTFSHGRTTYSPSSPNPSSRSSRCGRPTWASSSPDRLLRRADRDKAPGTIVVGRGTRRPAFDSGELRTNRCR
jgi:hypothetical protein